jgi:hypothetical protein
MLGFFLEFAAHDFRCHCLSVTHLTIGGFRGGGGGEPICFCFHAFSSCIALLEWTVVAGTTVRSFCCTQHLLDADAVAILKNWT